MDRDARRLASTPATARLACLPDSIAPCEAPHPCRRLSQESVSSSTALPGASAATSPAAGAPLLLVHSVNAAASAAEVRPVFEHYRAPRTVFALDLPGFGFSERSDRVYSPRLMTDACCAVRAQIRARCGRSRSTRWPSRWAASSSPARPSSAQQVRAAGPGQPHRTERHPPAPRRAGQHPRDPRLHRVLRGPGWGGALFRGLTRPGVIRYFLQRTWGAKTIDEALWAYDVETTRARRRVRATAFPLRRPVQRRHPHHLRALRRRCGCRTACAATSPTIAARLRSRTAANWRFSVFPTGALPYFEVPQDFHVAYSAFLKPH